MHHDVSRVARPQCTPLPRPPGPSGPCWPKDRERATLRAETRSSNPHAVERKRADENKRCVCNETSVAMCVVRCAEEAMGARDRQ